MMSNIGFPQWFTPIQTSYNTSGSDMGENAGGRPLKSEDELSEEGQNTRDKGTNIKE